MIKKIDNLDKIIDLLSFQSDDDFYFVQIISRKKDNKNQKKHEKHIASYYIKSKDDLFEKLETIKNLCKATNSRAYINLNVKSFKKVSSECVKNMLGKILGDESNVCYREFDSQCGKLKAQRDKRWLVDVDNENDNLRENHIVSVIAQIVDKKYSFFYQKVITPNGYHLITPPFNIQKFNHIFRGNLDVHKNNPTVLFCDLL